MLGGFDYKSYICPELYNDSNTHMTEQHTLIIVTSCAIAHLVMASVMAVFARYKIQYLSLTWILGIFAALLTAFIPFHQYINGTPGIMHPLMLLSITAGTYLQSIYPLGIPMPAYLQMGRMWKYASPAILLYATYGIAMLCGLQPAKYHDWSTLLAHWCSFDLLARLCAFLLTAYYLVNILRLPSKMAHKTEIPRYMKGYCLALSTVAIYYFLMSIWYSPTRVIAYLILFTLLNLYLCYRTLETIAIHLPKPVIAVVEKEPEPEAVAQAEKEDFNEANLQYFQRVEYWMQNHREEWTQTTFNRDILCEQVGLNRHLLLQCLRSQGYNDTHEYLNTYRYDELRRLIQRGKVRNLTETIDAGFGTSKTARSVFLKMSGGETLDAFLTKHKEINPKI